MPGWAGFLVLLAGFLGIGSAVESRRTRRRRAFIEGYVFPQPLERKLQQLYPELTDRDVHRVLAGLKEWFFASLEANGTTISMPSRVVDDAWHEFILMTRAYDSFCTQAFGRFLHHTPNAMASKPPKGGIPRTLDKLRKAGLVERGSLPALFTLDADLRIEDGRRWTLEEVEALKKIADSSDGCLGTSDSDSDSDGCGGCA